MGAIFDKCCFAAWCCFWLCFLLETDAVKLQEPGDANLTKWREHRRQKRFILFENAGISKMVCGITYPVDLSDKRPWRQLVLTFNLQYQFPVPPRPIYYWDKWDEDRALKRKTVVDFHMRAEATMPTVDEAQMFLYQFAVDLMNRQGMNGVACLRKAICENAQLHGHDGLFAELIYRVLKPHKSLDVVYLDAFAAGQRGTDCSTAFAANEKCLLDKYLHVREEVFEDVYTNENSQNFN